MAFAAINTHQKLEIHDLKVELTTLFNSVFAVFFNTLPCAAIK